MLRSTFLASLRPSVNRLTSTTLYTSQAATAVMTPISASLQQSLPPTVSSVRTLLKTHKGAAKRWRKMGNGGFKRGKAGHNHGNAGWSRNVINNVSGRDYAKGKGEGNHIKKLNRLLPYA